MIVTAGQILIDGVDIRDLKLEDPYRQMAMYRKRE
jgi:ABC-type multidrug transport system fused ATPase/permease subunit